MNDWLQHDWHNRETLLQTAVSTASDILDSLSERKTAVFPPTISPQTLAEDGVGTAAALEQFNARYADFMSASAGPRYLGFVTGGSTPAALLGDWLAAAYDQNVTADNDSAAPQLEAEAIRWLAQLFGLPDSFSGAFVSGATVSNMSGLAQGRQWVAQQQGIDVAQDGLYQLPPIPVLAATPHSSSVKALAMLGMGRHIDQIPTLPGREAMDVAALERRLAAQNGRSAIVIASGGTVNSVDFDDLAAIAALKERYSFWLHVDAAFGGFAACSPKFTHLLDGIALADSVTVDAHKWLNVPYDSAMIFTRHPQIMWSVFSNSAVYLGPTKDQPSLVHWTPQNSRRFRALPAWFSLLAYGRSGYREIVERNCAQAQRLGDLIAQSAQFELLDAVRLNVVCFTLAGRPDLAQVQAFLDALQENGRVFLTPTQFQGTPAIRAAFSNWMTQAQDVDIVWQALGEVGSG